MRELHMLKKSLLKKLNDSAKVGQKRAYATSEIYQV